MIFPTNLMNTFSLWRGPMRTIIFVFLFSLSTINPIHAFSGNSLAKYCASEGKENPFSSNTTLCIGLLHGYLEGLEYGFLITSTKMRLFCEPKEMTVKQLMKVFNKYLAEHPEKLHFEYGAQLIEAMREAFPCKNN